MGFETKMEREPRKRGRQTRKGSPEDSGLLSVSAHSWGSLLAIAQAVTLSPNEGAKRLLDMLGSH